MKKNLFTLLFCLFTNFIFSQVFSVYDNKNNEIYGYIVFELVEKTDKNQNLYLSTLLDINLNKVAQTTFTDDNRIKIGNVRYNGRTIYFEVIPQKANKESIESRDFSYRIYHLKDNSISQKYELPEKNKNIYVRGGYPIQGVGYGLIVRDFKTQVNRFYAISDDDNQVVYTSYPYGNPKKKKQNEHIITSGIYDNLMVTINRKFENTKAKDYRTTLLLVDISTGNTIKEISLDTEKFNIDLSDVLITEESIFAFGDSYGKKKRLTSGKTDGLFKAVIDHNGNVLQQRELVWADLQSKIDIKEGGFVKKNGYIYTHNYALDKKTKHTIVVGEYIKGSIASISVNDMVFLDFDENFNLSQVFEVEKKPSTLQFNGIKAGGSREFGYLLKDYNYFDYRFYNYLENESGLSFFYFNIEKVRFLGTAADFAHGIVVYKDGKFSANKLKWEGSVWKNELLNLLPSKPGYILLSKISKNKLENRLEKIDY